MAIDLRTYLDIVSRRIDTETDTGRVFLLMVLLEESLSNMLRALFVAEAASFIEGLTGKFHLKVALARSLGLLTKANFQDLKTLNSIRNRFAHRALDGTFDDPDVAPLVDQLSESNRSNRAEAFGFTAALMAERFALGVRYAGQCRDGTISMADLREAAANGFPERKPGNGP